MLEESLRRTLLADAPLEILVHLLREYRVAGGSQQEATSTLERLRTTAEQKQEDIILELLDLVTGFCAPHKAIW